MKKLKFILIFFIALQSCKQKNVHETIRKAPLPEITITHPYIDDISETEEINGQVVFLNKTTIVAPIAGYVTLARVKLNDNISKGKLVYKIQTKESRALQEANALPNKNFGIINVYPPATGYVSNLNIPDAGVFVNEGTPMLNIIKNTDLAIRVNAPFALSELLKKQKHIKVTLPNNEIKTAYFYKATPTVDAVSQTQNILFKLDKYSPLPENLNVLIKIPVLEKKNSILISKDAVLANETQDEFWVMKVNNDSLAIKIPIKKGIENNGKVAILEPKLSLEDKIVKKGAYGLADSTKVKIIK
ncbi:MAG TPA: HlyD family efflux transporter periplasmic adaptor subunit [Bacteroidetes bacterium]|nr:HlyD family efflux transporter periplasmic adaptor subunit [Bacteroidota bacterium]